MPTSGCMRRPRPNGSFPVAKRFCPPASLSSREKDPDGQRLLLLGRLPQRESKRAVPVRYIAPLDAPPVLHRTCAYWVVGQNRTLVPLGYPPPLQHPRFGSLSVQASAKNKNHRCHFILFALFPIATARPLCLSHPRHSLTLSSDPVQPSRQAPRQTPASCPVFSPVLALSATGAFPIPSPQHRPAQHRRPRRSCPPSPPPSDASRDDAAPSSLDPHARPRALPPPPWIESSRGRLRAPRPALLLSITCGPSPASRAARASPTTNCRASSARAPLGASLFPSLQRALGLAYASSTASEVHRARSKKTGALVALKKIIMHHEKDGVSLTPTQKQQSSNHPKERQFLTASPVSHHRSARNQAAQAAVAQKHSAPREHGR